LNKLMRGIIEFREKRQPDYREKFAHLALRQSPDALFVACSDSRVVPNLFASTNPGDLFVVRNVGNLVPPADQDGLTEADRSAAAALEFSVLALNVRDIIICGHSECGAMGAVLKARTPDRAPNLKSWLRYAEGALARLEQDDRTDPSLAPHNRLSQLNALEQVRHLESYPIVRERLEAGTLRLHAWWFDIANADVYAFDPAANRYELIDAAMLSLFDRAR
jgi:carbonic anhydrase